MKWQVCLILMMLVVLAGGCRALAPKPSTQWTPDEANTWYAEQPWLLGCNFTPSTAINQLEMWQAETFDPETLEVMTIWILQLNKKEE